MNYSGAPVAGDKVVVTGTTGAVVNATSKSYETDFVDVWTVTGGKVTACQKYLDTDAFMGAWRAN